eukprot:gene2507-2457_t
MGCMWIHGITKNPVYAMAQQLGVETQVTDYDNLKLFSPTGSLVDDGPVETQYDALSKQIDKY